MRKLTNFALLTTLAVALSGCGGSGSGGVNSEFEVQLSSSSIADLNLFISTSSTRISADSCSVGAQSFCESLEITGNDIFIRFRTDSDFSTNPVYVWVENEGAALRSFRVRIRRDGASTPAYDSNSTELAAGDEERFAEIRRNSVSPA